MKTRLGGRTWAALLTFGLFGQIAWVIENMYFNVFLYNTISGDTSMIAAMVAWSAVTATVTTLVMGALSDRLGRRKALIVIGYLLWGVSIGAFAFIKRSPLAGAAHSAAVLVVVMDCVMTFFGSTANDAAFNAWVTDVTVPENRGRVETVLAIMPLVAMLVVVSLFIIANTIKLATFYRREEIAIMKMCGATNGFIRWPFVYEGFMLGLTGAILAFLLQWGLYEAIAQGVADNDTLQLLSIVPFQQLWKPVGGVFLGAGILIGVGGSLSAIRRFLQV